MVNGVGRVTGGAELAAEDRGWLPEPDERFQESELAEQLRRFASQGITGESPADWSVMRDFLHRAIESDQARGNLSEIMKMSPEDVKKQVTYLVAESNPSMDRGDVERIAGNYFRALKSAAFDAFQQRVCDRASHEMHAQAELMRQVAGDDDKLAAFKAAFVALHGKERFEDTFGVDSDHAGAAEFRQAVLQNARQLDEAAGSLTADHVLGHYDVFKSMPEFTRQFRQKLEPGSFARDVFDSGLAAHSRERKAHEAWTTAVKLGSSVAISLLTMGLGTAASTTATVLSTFTSGVDTANSWRNSSEAMRFGILTRGMSAEDWQAADTERFNDLVRGIASTVGSLAGAFGGRPGMFDSLGVEATAAGMEAAQPYAPKGNPLNP